MKEYTPKEVVIELDKYIVGQGDAKKAVAVALRNRMRRQKLSAELQEDITPKNILMIGPTGVGKTEIARRLAKLVKAPFIKVEASKFTEVGYVGRDVESMVRDLVQSGVSLVKEDHMAMVRKQAELLVDDKLLDLLLPPIRHTKKTYDEQTEEEKEREKAEKEKFENTREKLKKQLIGGTLEDKFVEVNISQAKMPMMEIFSGQGMEEIGINLQDMMGGGTPQNSKKKKVSVREARELILNEEIQKLVDMDKVKAEAIERVENTGIIFIDELDKVTGNESKGSGPDVSREGVQRDILPIVEGTTVTTKHGSVKTDHILFIAAGAFHVSKPSDLIPELQGRFPIRVELNSLTQDDFERILQEPKNSLIKQYEELLFTEDVKLTIDKDAIKAIAQMAYEVNETTENIGARRLHTIMEKVLEEFLFDAPYGKHEKKQVSKEYVESKIDELVKDRDLSKYIL